MDRGIKIVLALLCISVIAAGALLPAAGGVKYYNKDALVKMNGEINNAPISEFVEPLPQDHKKLMKQDWIDFQHEVDEAVKSGRGEVDNNKICASIWLHVWSWKELFWNLRGAALCP